MKNYWIALNLPTNKLASGFKPVRPDNWSIERFDPSTTLSEELLQWFSDHKLTPLINVIFQRYKQHETSYHADYAIPQPIAAINFQLEGTAIHTFYKTKVDVSVLVDKPVVNNHAYTAKEYKREDLELVDTLTMKNNNGYIVRIDVPHHVKATSEFRSVASIRFRDITGKLLTWQEIIDRFA